MWYILMLYGILYNGLYSKLYVYRFCGSNKHKKQDCPDRKAAKRINNEEQDEVVADVLTNDKDSADKEIHRDTSLFMRSVRTSGLSGKPTGTSSTRRKPKFVKF